MGSTDSLPNKIHSILILGDNFPAAPIIHALSHSRDPVYDIHIAHPHPPLTPQVQHSHSHTHGHGSTTHHTTRVTPSALSPLLSELHPDIVIDTTSTSSFDTEGGSGKKALIDFFLAAGIPRFMPCDFGHDSLNPGIQGRLPVYRERARVVEYLQQLVSSSFSDNGGREKFTWCAVACGVILDRGISSKNLGFDLAWRNASMHGSGDERFAASSSAWIGRVLCGVVEHWDDRGVRNQYLRAAESVTTANEVLRALESAMSNDGRPWTAERGDVEVCVREAEKRIERGFPDAGMFLLERSVLYDESLNAVEAFEREDANGVLGLKREGLEGTVREVVREYRDDGGGKAGCGCD